MTMLIKSSRHFPDTLMNAYRQQGDAPADAVMAAVVAEGGMPALRALMGALADTSALQPDKQPAAVRDFWAAYAQLPAWADTARMARGMAFFNRNAGHIGLILGCFSLPYCYLGADGAQVLWLTERIKNDTARRLQETGEWVFAVNNPKSWQPGPAGQPVPDAIDRTLNVRLLHAGARWFTQHSGRWDVAWGVPINQEDMAGTNLAFSYVVLLGLRRAGVDATEEDEEDYLHHINVVNWLNGVQVGLLPRNLREAYVLGRSIARRQFKPSEAGAGLTRALLNAIAVQGGGGLGQPDTIRNLAAGEMRFFLGDLHADWLEIPRVPLEKRMAGLLNRLPVFSQFRPVG